MRSGVAQSPIVEPQVKETVWTSPAERPVATLSVSSIVLTAADAAGDQLAEATPTPRIQNWIADHEALVDVKLGYLKAVVRMTNSQNELWDAFEKAVRCAAKARRIYDVRQMLADHERRSPTERMDAMAGRMARRANELKEISEAPEPLYSGLDDTQKRKFELLSREIIMTVSGPMWGKLGADDEGAWLPNNLDE
jgi:hypothetical protein